MQTQPTQLLKLPDVEKAVRPRRTALCHTIAEGRFPRPIKIGFRAVAWRQSEIEAWIASREAA